MEAIIGLAKAYHQGCGSGEFQRRFRFNFRFRCRLTKVIFSLAIPPTNGNAFDRFRIPAFHRCTFRFIFARF